MDKTPTLIGLQYFRLMRSADGLEYGLSCRIFYLHLRMYTLLLLTGVFHRNLLGMHYGFIVFKTSIGIPWRYPYLLGGDTLEILQVWVQDPKTNQVLQ